MLELSIMDNQLQAKISWVFQVLEQAYRPRRWRADSHYPPLDELILTILSQHTSDQNSIRAFKSLREHFRTWDEVAHAPIAELVESIRSGGLAVVKAPRIQEVLRTIHAQRGNYDLNFLADLPLAEAKAYLYQLKGVGPKTAACVLLFALGRPALPVDTHVHRVSKRLGLIGPKVGEAQAHVILEGLLEPEQVYSFHINMIAHGRTLCKAQDPRCEACPLQSRCDYYQTVRVNLTPLKRGRGKLRAEETAHGNVLPKEEE